jgi:hypothetical protein
MDSSSSAEQSFRELLQQLFHRNLESEHTVKSDCLSFSRCCRPLRVAGPRVYGPFVLASGVAVDAVHKLRGRKSR